MQKSIKLQNMLLSFHKNTLNEIPQKGQIKSVQERQLGDLCKDCQILRRAFDLLCLSTPAVEISQLPCMSGKLW